MRRVAGEVVLAGCLLAGMRLLLPAQEIKTDPPLETSKYVQALDRALPLARKLETEPKAADELLKQIPLDWTVNENGRTFQISNETLRRDLVAWQKNPRGETLQHIVQHLETLRYEAAYNPVPAPDASASHLLLNNILSRREFEGVHGQTWMDQLNQRIHDLLLRILGQALASSAIPVISDILVYGLIVAAVLVLAYWMYRSLIDSTNLETIMVESPPVSAKEWPLWVAEARAAAARGDWRDAVHLAYWGGISFLEGQGAWRADSARTPREYLRLFRPAAFTSLRFEPLTGKLEIVWYGMQTADSDSFQQTLAELEKLGCPCN